METLATLAMVLVGLTLMAVFGFAVYESPDEKKPSKT